MRYVNLALSATLALSLGLFGCASGTDSTGGNAKDAETEAIERIVAPSLVQPEYADAVNTLVGDGEADAYGRSVRALRVMATHTGSDGTIDRYVTLVESAMPLDDDAYDVGYEVMDLDMSKLSDDGSAIGHEVRIMPSDPHVADSFGFSAKRQKMGWAVAEGVEGADAYVEPDVQGVIEAVLGEGARSNVIVYGPIRDASGKPGEDGDLYLVESVGVSDGGSVWEFVTVTGDGKDASAKMCGALDISAYVGL